MNQAQVDGEVMADLEEKVAADYKVLSTGDGHCINSDAPHAFKGIGRHYHKFDNYRIRYHVLYCQQCGETIEVVYARDWGSEN